MVSGGFAYLEQVGFDLESDGFTRDLNTFEIPDYRSLRDFLRRALRSQGLFEGQDWSFEPLPMSHPLFHSYYDFDSIPTNFWDTIHRHNQYGGMHFATEIPPYLEGVHLDGRLVAVYSQQNYRDFWDRRPERVIAGFPADPTSSQLSTQSDGECSVCTTGHPASRR